MIRHHHPIFHRLIAHITVSVSRSSSVAPAKNFLCLDDNDYKNSLNFVDHNPAI